MGFSDRHYNRPSFRGGGPGGGIFGFLSSAIPMGSVFGIRVRVHMTFLIMIAYFILKYGDIVGTLIWVGLLFGSVLLHEFGHCLACRKVGGTADDILMWPLGGLATCQPPNTPYAHFWTIAWGPLVNVIICAMTWAGLAIATGTAIPISLNPFAPDFGVNAGMLESIVRGAFFINYMLMLFNLALIFYPFDGGRLVQIVLWMKLGYMKSMLVATTFGMGGAVCVAALGLYNQMFMLVLIAGFGFMTCFQQRKQIMMAGASGMSAESGGGQPGGGSEDPWSRQNAADEREVRRATKLRDTVLRAEKTRNADVDRILDKVARSGIQSLSSRDKKTLEDATHRQRNR